MNSMTNRPAGAAVEQWDIFELVLDGPATGNPFLDVTLSAEFRQQNRVLEPDGFYDGDGIYRVRFMPDMPGEWRYFKIVQQKDPYQHLRSVHNGDPEMNYDHTKPWITHVCIQNWDVKRTREWRNTYGKPITNDECEYEGNIPRPWGNISAQELTHRFWITFVKGGYAGHGETYVHPDDILWWGKGGVLHGESWKRIAFLREIFEELPPGGLEPMDGRWEWSRVSAGSAGDTRILYFGEHQPVQWAIGLPMDDSEYDIDIIDTWNMTITPIQPGPLPVSPPTRGGVAQKEAAFGVELPGKPYMALRVRPK